MDRDDFFSGPHRCRRCPASYSTPDKLERHVEAEHPGVRRVRHAAVAAAATLAVAVLVLAVQPGPPPPAIDAFHVDDDPMLGRSDAPVHVVVFESPSCPACLELHRDLLPDLVAGPVARGEVAVHFLSAPPSVPIDHHAAVAQECSHRHGSTDGYQAFTKALLGNQSILDEHVVHEMLEDYAARRNIPEEVIMRCYYAEEALGAVEQDWRVARERGAAAGTVLLVQGQTVTGTDADGLRALLG